MTLKCTRCGTETTHADAQIADLHRSCGGSEHDWIDTDIEIEMV